MLRERTPGFPRMSLSFTLHRCGTLTFESVQNGGGGLVSSSWVVSVDPGCRLTSCFVDLESPVAIYYSLGINCVLLLTFYMVLTATCCSRVKCSLSAHDHTG